MPWPGLRTRCRSAAASSPGGRTCSTIRGPPPAGWESELMKTDEYRGMSDEQLSLTLKDVTKNLFHLRFQSATERLETPSEIRKARREVARIKTILRERE